MYYKIILILLFSLFLVSCSSSNEISQDTTIKKPNNSSYLSSNNSSNSDFLTSDSSVTKYDDLEFEFEIVDENKIKIIGIKDVEKADYFHIKIPEVINNMIVTEIDFDHLPNIYSIYIPASIQKIEYKTISDIHEIIVDAKNKIYDSRDNCKCLIETKINKLLLLSKAGFIPDSVRILDKYCAYFSDIREIYIPAYVVEIEDIFIGCKSLTSIIVDKKNPIYDSRNDCNAIIETKNNKIIATCKNSIIDDSIEIIGRNAFQYVEISELKVPKNVKLIERGSIEGCSTKKIIVDKNNMYYDSRNDCNSIIESSSNSLIKGCENSIVPKNINKICSRAFYDVNMDYIDLSNEKIIIEKDSFIFCSFNDGIYLNSKAKVLDCFRYCYIKCLYINDNYVSSEIKSLNDNNTVKTMLLKGDFNIVNGKPQKIK